MYRRWQRRVRGVKFQARAVVFRDRLLAWFAEHGRDLPWRQTRDPYAILVSELMLQQTQVDRVLDYYTRFLARFPTFEALARASEEEVVAAWEGLGYYNRARNFRKLARVVTDEYSGAFPTNIEEIRALPGIGEYTAGAVMTFALERRAPIVDTNVNRVITRVFLFPVADGAFEGPAEREKVLWLISDALLPETQFWEFNQAIMDFGALQCPARAPRCNSCPMRSSCRYFRRSALDRFFD